MKKTARWALRAGFLFATVILAVVLLKSSRPPIRLKVLSREPTTHLRLINDTAVGKNYFFVIEVKTNATWIEAAPQTPDAYYVNYVAPHSFRDIELAFAPAKALRWRCAVNYQDPNGSWFYQFTERLGPLKNFLRRHH